MKATSENLGEIEIDVDVSDGPALVIVCAGPPACQKQDLEAVAAQKAGCVWCRRIMIDEEGRETEMGPGHA